MLCSIGFIAKHYGVSPSTIRRWVKLGYIRIAGRTFGGHRRFDVPDEVSSEQASTRKHIGYARVSSHDQKEDLARQSARLREARCEEVIEDIGSGLNCSKPGLRSLLRQLLDGHVKKLSVVHEDRLLRFGVGLIRQICRRMRSRRSRKSRGENFRRGARPRRHHADDGLLRPSLRQAQPPQQAEREGSRVCHEDGGPARSDGTRCSGRRNIVVLRMIS